MANIRFAIVTLFMLLTITYAYRSTLPRQSWLHLSRTFTSTSSSPSSSSRLYMGALESSPMELCEENAAIVIEEIRTELGTIFGYDAGSRSAGITGEIDLVEVDGPNIVIKLKGRFWHATDTVMMRVESFVKNRIPEVISVTLDTKLSNIIDDNNLNTDGGVKKKLF